MRGETQFYLLAVALVAGYIAISALVWAALNLGQPPSPVLVNTFWTWQIALGLIVAAFGWLGYQPAIHIHLDSDGLRVAQRGAAPFHLMAGDIDSVTRISGDTVQQHYLLYSETRLYIGRAMERFILLSTATGPVILGIDPAEQTEFMEHVTDLISRNKEARVA